MWLHGEGIRLYTADQDGLPDQTRHWQVEPVDTFGAEIAHWLDCLDRGRVALPASPIRAEEQRKPLLAVLAAYTSMQREKRVYLAELERTHREPHPGGRDDGTER
jgi:predicted dehydrogenase